MGPGDIDRERLESILQGIGEGIIYQEEDGNIKLFNQAAQRIFGLSKDLALSRTSMHPDWRLVHEDGSPCPGEEHPSMITLRTGQGLSEQIRGIAKPGQPVTWLSINTRPLFRPGQELPEAVVISFSDITQRKRDQEALRQSEEKFAKAFQRAPLLMSLSLLEDGTCLEVNDTFCQVSGFSRQEALGRTTVELGWLKEADRRELVESLTTKGWVRSRELTLTTKDGRAVNCLFNGEVISHQGRQVLIAVALDITERKLTEEQLRSSQGFSQSIIESSPDCIKVLDLQGRLKFMNSGGMRLLGLDHLAPYLDKPYETFWSGSDLEQARRALERAKSGEKANFLGFCPTVAGEPKWWDVNVSPITNSLGQPTSILVVSRDITERKRVEEELRASEESNRQILHTAMDGFWRVDAQGRILEVNQTYCQMSGYSPYELLKMRISDLEAEETRRETAARIRQLIEKGEDRFPGRHRRKDGSLFDVEVSAQYKAGEQGGEFVVFLRDVSDRLRTQRELRASEERFRQLYEHAPIAYQSLDPNGRVLDVNQVWLDTLGYSREEVVGRWFGEFLRDDYLPHFQKNFPQFKEEGHISGVEFMMAKKDGSAVHVSFTGSIARNTEGRMIRTHCVFHDITEHRRLEAQLRQAQKMEALGTLSGGIAHDFNNILGAVLGFAEIARDDAQEGRADPRDLDQIIVAAQRAKELVRQILTFSRKNEPALQPLSLNLACRKAQDILRRTLPKMIAIETDLAEGLPLVQADPTQVEQVLLNLASNAADAMPEGGRLIMATHALTDADDYRRLHPEIPAGEYVLLAVSDTGCGMEAAVREHIFEPFFTTKEVGQGTGLGLSTAYGIVKTHKGFIYCYSQPGQGSTFSIYLPAMIHLAPPDAVQEAGDESAPGGSETILLVDDEETLRVVAARMLHGAGYQVLEAASGEEALEVLGRLPDPPAMVIMDLGMPGMGGRKAMEIMLGRHPRTKVVIASGYAALAQVKASLEAGAAAYVAKPFRRHDLLQTIRQALDQGGD